MDLISQFQAGGFFMYFILLFGILTVGIIVERWFALYRNYKTAPLNFRNQVLNLTTKGDFDSAIDYVQTAAGHTSLGKVTATGLKIRAQAGGDEELQARMDEKLTEEISTLDKRTGFLSMFGNVSTLFGLLGTVTGLISSFAGVAAASPVERANLLSQGISEALNSTAFGLTAAIPALVAFAVYQSRTDKLTTELTEGAAQIYHDLLFKSETVTMPMTKTTKSNTSVTSMDL